MDKEPPNAKNLKDFVKVSIDILNLVISDFSLLFSGGYIPKRIQVLNEELKDAQDEVRSKLDLKLADDNFFNQEFKNQGLSGPELKLKLSVFNYRKHLFYQAYKEIKSNNEKHHKSYHRSTLQKVFEIIKSISGSIPELDYFKEIIEIYQIVFKG